MTLNGVIALILRFPPNSIALLANYVTVVEDRRVMSVKYCLPVPAVFYFRPKLIAIAELLVTLIFTRIFWHHGLANSRTFQDVKLRFSGLSRRRGTLPLKPAVKFATTTTTTTTATTTQLIKRNQSCKTLYHQVMSSVLAIRPIIGQLKQVSLKPRCTRCSAIAERPRCRVRYSFRQK